MRYDPHDIEDMTDDEWSEKYEPSGAGVTWPVFVVATVVVVVFSWWSIYG